MRRQATDWEKIIAKITSDKRLFIIHNIEKKNIKFSHKKTNNTIKKCVNDRKYAVGK